jgi:hypothetical protein
MLLRSGLALPVQERVDLAVSGQGPRLIEANRSRTGRIRHAVHGSFLHDAALPDSYANEGSAAVNPTRRRRCGDQAVNGRLVSGASGRLPREDRLRVGVRPEKAVQESLGEGKEDLLLFLVAHRLCALSIYDRVVVIVDGRRQAIDEPVNLLEQNESFRGVFGVTLREGAR